MSYLAKGRETERHFVDCYIKRFGKRPVTWATNEQDMYEHWDVQIGDKKIDVKGCVQFGRGTGAQDTYNRIELTNVHGNKGWLYGGSDFIVYETADSWIIVDRLWLVALVDYILRREGEQSSLIPKLYHVQTRNGRNDRLLWVLTEDIREIAKIEIEKFCN